MWYSNRSVPMWCGVVWCCITVSNLVTLQSRSCVHVIRLDSANPFKLKAFQVRYGDADFVQVTYNTTIDLFKYPPLCIADIRKTILQTRRCHTADTENQMWLLRNKRYLPPKLELHKCHVVSKLTSCLITIVDALHITTVIRLPSLYHCKTTTNTSYAPLPLQPFHGCLSHLFTGYKCH